MKFKHILVIILLFSIAPLSSAQVGVGTTSPHESAALDMDVSNLPATGKKGFLIPRVELESNIDDSTIPAPANNLIVYNKENNGTSPNEILANFIYSWRDSHWDKFSNLPEVKLQKVPIDFAIAGKAKQIFTSSEVSSLNSTSDVNTVPIVWNTGSDVVIDNPTDVILFNDTQIKILTSSLYQISGVVSFKPDASAATNCVITLQKSNDNGASWVDIIGSAMPFSTTISAHNETIVFPDSVQKFEANDLIRFVVSRPKNPLTTGPAPADYGSGSGIQSRLDSDINKSFRFTRLEE